MVKIMDADKFYIIKDNVVINVAVFNEADAVRLNLKRAPIRTEFGIVDTDWTYLPEEDRFLPPPRDILKEWAAVNAMRDSLLAESNMYVLPDMWDTYTQDEKNAWTVYRQKLRSINTDFVDPKEVVWPQKPWVEQMESIKPSTPEV
jgi:hypothetical protein